jgi:hypothetical protein
MLRYDDMEAFTALAIFIGDTPKEAHRKFERNDFGTCLSYMFNVFAVAEQDEATLIASDNIIALAVLAAKYTFMTTSNDINRFAYKRKVFELAVEKKIPRDKILNLLIFVHEIMDLSADLEFDFNERFPIFNEKNADNMNYHPIKTDLAEAWYAQVHGKTFKQEIEELIAEKEAEKEAEKKAEQRNIILKLHNELSFSAEKIADLMEYDLAFVSQIIADSTNN